MPDERNKGKQQLAKIQSVVLANRNFTWNSGGCHLLVCLPLCADQRDDEGNRVTAKKRAAPLDIEFTELQRRCQLGTVVTVVAVVGAPVQLDGSLLQLPFDGRTLTRMKLGDVKDERQINGRIHDEKVLFETSNFFLRTSHDVDNDDDDSDDIKDDDVNALPTWLIFELDQKT